VLGGLLAFLLAVVTVLYDCHVSIQERLKRVPMPIFRTPQAIGFAIVCGVVAVVAFGFTDDRGDTLVDAVLGLKLSNPLARGAAVGLTVLVLIRSKLSSFKGAEIGGELIYNAGRAAVMQSLNSKWRAYKSRFNRLNLESALATPDYENRILTELREALRVQPEDFRTFVETQIKNVVPNRPQPPLDPSRPDWQAYYRTLTNLALDYAGPTVFEGWFTFKDPRKQ
jgi:hypothetical protein